MNSFRWHFAPGVTAAMLASAALGAQFVAATSARDALFLTGFNATALPIMMIASSAVSIVFVALAWLMLRRVPPATHVPLTFAVSALLIVAEWELARLAPRAAARIFYLHVTGLLPLLGSGFWLVMSERFDPRTAKKHFGQIGGAQTLGGFVGGLLAASLAAQQGVTGMLLLPAVLQALGAWQVRTLARGIPAVVSRRHAHEAEAEVAPSAFRVLAQAPYVRTLAAVVLLVATSAVFVDYVFKFQVAASFEAGASLGTFFSFYNAALSLVTFTLQAFGTRALIERLGLAAATAAPSLMLVTGSALAIIAPGLWSFIVAHGGERVTHGSFLRTGQEQFCTPLAPADRRAIKATIDVGAARAGDILGGGSVQMLILVAGQSPTRLLLSCAIGTSMLALFAARSLTRGYVTTLEQSLQHRAVEIDLSETEDVTTRTVVLKSVRRQAANPPTTPPIDMSVREVAVLRSRDPEAIRRVLAEPEGLRAPLVPHVIALLAWDPVAYDAIRALRGVAEERVGQLVDALIDPNQPFAVRRRLARVFSVCVSQRAADGLVLGLDDLRFEVRFHCGRSLAAIVEKNPRVRIDREAILETVLREVAVSRSVWEGRQLLDGTGAGEDEQSLAEQAVSERASQSLAHVFTLLGLILPRESLRLAFNALHSADPRVRGTALEYLDAVLPREIRERLWPFLEVQLPTARSARRREEILADLVRANETLFLDVTADDHPPGVPGRPASRPPRSS